MAERDAVRGNDVAIIGMAGRFPGAPDIDRFWDNLRLGVESVARLQPGELESSWLLSPAMRDKPSFVPAGGILGDGERFDHAFFDVAPAEARRMDPQLRLMLECVFAALEDAGHDPHAYQGKIALYAGAGSSQHALTLLDQVKESPAALYDALTTSAEMIALRVAHALNLRGESISIYTACSTGLVAVHLACQSLLLRQSDMAIAAGVRLSLPERTGYLYQEGMILSPDGHCRVFDERARGTVVGHGAGVVVLKLLEDALRDGDHIHAVIRGSAINNDGAGKVGFTAPSVKGQSEVIGLALSYAEVDPDSIGYVEAHGTGTSLGDPIEIAALTRAYREHTDRRGYCALGSVKSNIGHLDAAAGVVGLIKAALALSRREIPPSLHFERPNPSIDFDASPFFVNTTLRPFTPQSGEKRRAAVSSFGIGGTNAHAVLEEAPPRESALSRRGALLFTLSARTEPALEEMTARLATHVERHPEQPLPDVAYTLAVGRRAFESRRSVVARDREELCRKLRDNPPPPIRKGDEPPRVAWLFPGQGAQAAGMGEALYRAESLFRRRIDEASEVLRSRLGFGLDRVIAPAADRREEAARTMERLEVALPALFAVEYALAALWMSFGLRAGVFLGHSFGEYTAACLSGVFSFEDALRVSHTRGELIHRTAPGRMLAVALAAEELGALLGPELDLAAMNARDRSVVSGPAPAIEALAEILVSRKVAVSRLPVSHAFHSSLLDPILGDLEAAFARISLRPPREPYISSRTGASIRAEEATDPAYWAAQTRAPVRFAAGLDALFADGYRAFVEVGPDHALSAMVRAHLDKRIRAWPSLPRRGTATDAHAVLFDSLGALWAAGAVPDVRMAFDGEARRRVPLPSYPFAGPRFEGAKASMDVKAAAAPVKPELVKAASSSTEEQIAALWCELLGVEHLDVHASFLEIGGNSLLAVQALNRLRDMFAIELPLSDLFDALSVRALAVRVDERRREFGMPAPSPAIPPKPSLRRPSTIPLTKLAKGAPRSLSYVQERVMDVAALEPSTPALNMPILVRLSGQLEPNRLEEAIGAIVGRHDGLRTVYRPDGAGGWTPVVLEHVPTPLAVVVSTEPTAEERLARAAARMTAEAVRPFDLERGPVLRAALFQLDTLEYRLVLTVHHVIADTTTLLVIAHELLDRYEALVRGAPLALPVPEIQYHDYADWQRRLIDEGALAEQIAHWRNDLASMPVLSLGAPLAAGGREGIRLAIHEFSLGGELSRAVSAFGRRRGTTTFVILLSAYAILLGRAADTEEVVVGTPLGNRYRPELFHVIGYVAQSAALRIDLTGEPNFSAVVRRVHDTMLKAQEHGDVPFEMLAKELGRTRDPKKVRLFDAVMVLHSIALDIGTLSGLDVELLEAGAVAQFGATLATLSLLLNERDAGIFGQLCYDPDRFDAAAAARLVEEFSAVIEAALDAPEAPIRVVSRDHAPARAKLVASVSRRPLDFSLFYFATDEAMAAGKQKYRTLLGGARRADELGFSALWTPERHFHPFGGTFPNPAITSAALATITERIGLRAGSVVLPLHHPARVAEDWAVIDNLSGGRVGIAFASGWHARDFVFAPGKYAERRAILKEGIDRVRRLWRGEELRLPDGAGHEIGIRIYPRPVQRELPVWLTSGGTPETFRLAGELGAYLLTNLMGQKLEDLTSKIASYREAWAAHGHGPGRGHVTLMMHAFVGPDLEMVRRTVREPMLSYLRSSVDVMQGFAATASLDTGGLSGRDLDRLLEMGFDRYMHAGGLFGTVDSCLPLVEQVRGVDVDEIACLVDFGVAAEAVIEHLDSLAALMRAANENTSEPRRAAPARGAAPAMAPPRPVKRRPPAIRRMADRREAPLSFAQQRLWFLDQLTPHNPSYNNALALSLTGPLDIDALVRSLKEIAARHEVLRTAFVTDPAGEPVQRILDALDIAVPLVEIAGDPSAQKAEVARRMTALVREPFDLDTPPLMRAILFRLDERAHVLGMAMHHIVSDGWSGAVLFTEIATLYRVFHEGKPSPLSPLPVQYADYSVWQREWLTGDVLTAEVDHWKGALEGVSRILDLPADRPRPRVMSHRGAIQPILVPRSVFDRMAALGREVAATPFMAIVAVFGALLSRYTGQDRVAFGTATAGRSRPEVEQLLGCFVNTLVLGVDLRGAPSFRELLGRVRRMALQAFEHLDLPFEKLVDALSPERDLGRTPLIQAMLILHNTPPARARLDDLSIESLPVETGTAKFDISVELTETPEGLRGALEYATDPFTPETAARMVKRFVRLIEAAVTEPDAPILSLPIMDEDELAKLRAFSATATQYPSDKCIHDLFEDQARKTPDAVAVEYSDEQLTYAELLSRASRLAHHLRDLGVGPEVFVGLFAERSLNLVVGLLAVLLAGGAYVPLDPSYPADRLSFMIADTRMPVLLAEAGLWDKLPPHGATTVRLDADATSWAGKPSAPPEPRGCPDNPVYVIYTSGSTGQPKGVVVEHRALVNHMTWFVRELGFGPEDRVLQKSPLSFDVSVWEIWAPWCVGARVVLAPPGAHRFPRELGEIMRKRRVTVFHGVPILLSAMVDEGALAHIESLRLVCAGGEELGVDLLHALERMARCDVQNLYGPTEATIEVITWKNRSFPGARVPIGSPRANVRAYVLDRDDRLVPPGIAGELHLAGVQLARGYLGRPALTAACFVPDPFSDEPGARMYRTGDLARWNAEDELEFLGRIDRQVKIRGYRIELGEIEAALLSHPDVRACVVSALEDSPEHKRLVAYVVPAGGAWAPGALREHLRAILPEHMCPTAYVRLAALPLLPSGKVDVRSLPAPELEREDAGTSPVAPSSEIERALARVFVEVLRLPEVGVLDNFFALGGDSILAIQVVSRARRAGLFLSARDLFEHQTIADLAPHVRTSAAAEQGSAAAAAEQGMVVGAVPLTAIQRWFFEAHSPEPHHFHQALWFTAPRRVAPSLIASALEAVLRQHDALRLRFFHTEAGWHEEHTPDAGWPLELVDLSSLTVSEQAAAMESFASAMASRSSLASGPLARAAHFDLGEAEPRLLLLAHHLIVDGVSWHTLHEDLEKAAADLLAGRAPDLGPKTTSFRAFSEWMFRRVVEGGLYDELPFWLSRCALGAPALPFDRPGSLGTAGEGRGVEVHLSENDTALLLREVMAQHRAAVLLAALAEALCDFQGSTSTCIALEADGRELAGDEIDVSRTVGWFTALVPVWLKIPSPGEHSGPSVLFRSVVEALRSMPRGGLGHGWLQAVHPDPAVRAALAVKPPVLFDYLLGQLDAAADERGLFSLVRKPLGLAMSPRTPLRYALSIHGAIAEGRLGFVFMYSARVHDEVTIQRLAERYRGSLERLIAHAASDAVRSEENAYPLSPMQAGMLVSWLRDPSSPMYTMQTALEIGGEVDAGVLEAAFREIVSRHAVYRTTFVWQDVPEPLQVVHRSVPFVLSRHDLSSLPDAEALAQWESMLAEDRRAPFDLSRASLLRVMLVRLPRGRTWVVKTEHHIVSDGWSGPLILGEVQAIYGALRKGARPTLADPAPYERYIAWLSGRDRAAAERFFRVYLRGVTEPTRLELPRPSGEHEEAPREAPAHVMALSEEATEIALAFTRRHGLTVNTVLQGALALVLGRYADRSDVVFGVTSSGRSAPVAAIERMVGLFINTLPLRARWSADDRVLPWLRALQVEQAEVRAHEATSLWDVQRWSEIESGRSLFDTLLVFENFPVDRAHGPELPLPVIDARFSEQAKYPLMLVAILGRTLEVRMTWEPEVLRRTDVDRFAGHIETLLLDMVMHPERRLTELSMLTSAERVELRTFHAAASEYPRTRCIHDLFEEQAQGRPDAVAVEYEDERLTYRELSERSCQLAHFLRGLGVGPDVVVALMVERSTAMIVGLLGILKAGGAYLPIDPSHPAERVSAMLEDARASLVLTQAHLERRIAADGVRVVRLDADADLWAKEARAALESGALPEGLAYVLFTSGSTGTPKGVLVSHRAVVRLVRGTNYASFDDRQSFLGLAPLAYDASTLEIWAPLTNGGRLVIHRAGPVSLDEVADVIRRRAVTTLWLTAGLFASLVESHPECLEGVEQLLTGGDVVSPRHARIALQWVRGKVVNGYGPTENTTFTTYHPIRRADTEANAISIGKPIANTRVYVLDANLGEAPRGVTGEIYAGGDGLARGYLNAPALTATRFVPDPFAGDPGARMYRTGDLGRWNERGELEFRGRADEQVKIRGFRVEPSEIEAALCEQGAVRACAVVPRPEKSGDKRLVAYLVRREPSVTPTPGELRAHLSRSLPEFMIPSAFLWLDDLPLLASGKVARNALPAPEPTQNDPSASYVAALTPTEGALFSIWEELLDARPIGVEDDFFALGGHSLLAMRLFTAIEQRFGFELPLASLFEQRTIKALAIAIDSASVAEKAQEGSPLVPLRMAGSKRPLFCVHPLGGTVFCFDLLARMVDLERPVFGLQALAPAGHAETIFVMAERYVAAIQGAEAEGPYHLVGYSFGALVAFEMAHVLLRKGAAVGALVLLDPPAPRSQPEAAPQEPVHLLVHLAQEHDLPVDLSALLASSAEEASSLCADAAEKAGVALAGRGREFVSAKLALLSAHAEALARYVPRSYPGSMRLVLVGDEDGRASSWASLCAGGVRVARVAGTHHHMLRLPYVTEIARVLEIETCDGQVFRGKT